MKAEDFLKKYFGYDSFRPGQKEMIEHILKKEDCLGIMPTGAGKSICYQISALMLPGITLVISPLISLMKDQVDSLNSIGIPATYINSSLSEQNYRQTLQNISYNLYKIIYIAPERLLSETFLTLLYTLNISLIAIDEAHCVSQWGHDFRPSYLEIPKMISTLKTRPIITAFTATATKFVKYDIIQLLNLNQPFVLTTGFDRANLYFSIQIPENKNQFLLDFLENHKKISGIIYCSTRKNVDSLFEKLSDLHYSVSKYHGGMTEKERNLAQENFIYDRTEIMIATNAFGMGIDKSNIRYVIHYNMPQDLESYYQEAGRAGRDGDYSQCILLFNRSDVVTHKFLIEQSSSEDHSNEYQKLNDMIDYCNTDKCLRNYILQYFGETPNFTNCNFCSNCSSTIEKTDITLESQKIFSCIKRMKERFGAGLITDVLKGSKSSKIKTLGFQSLSTYGILSDYSKDTIRDLISFLIAENYILSTETKYPVLKLTEKANEVLFSGKTIVMKKRIEKNIKKQIEDSKYFHYDSALFEILRTLRKEISTQDNVPPFIVFTDVSLKQMATYYPTDKESMLKINGVGELKFSKYGDVFLKTIQNYIKTMPRN